MSFHRIFLIGAYVLCTTTAFANNDIDMNLYEDAWPSNYFKLVDTDIFDQSRYMFDWPVKTSTLGCLWSRGALSPSLSRMVSGADDDTMSPMWLRSDSEFDGDYQMMLCGTPKFKFSEIEPELWGAISENRDAAVPSCAVDGIVSVNRPQIHLGDTVGYKYWKCSCDSKGCSWKETQPEMKCDRYKMFLLDNETRKYLLQVDSNTVVMCGAHHDNTDKIGSNTNTTPRSITFGEGACAPGVEYATLYPNSHLNDRKGNKIWRCVCRGNNCEWTLDREIETCSSNTIPDTGLGHTINTPQYSSNAYAKGLLGDKAHTKDILVNRDQVIQHYNILSKDGDKEIDIKHFGHVGYPYLADLNPDSSSAKFPANMCVSSICVGDNVVPNRDYSACIKRRVDCIVGGTKYRISTTTGHHCDIEQTEVPMRIKGVDPVYQYLLSPAETFKTHPSFEAKDQELCNYTCTEMGWVIRVNAKSCADGYVPSYNKRACLSSTDIAKGVCEKTGGVIVGDNCKCQGRPRRKVYQHNEYEYCDDPKTPIVEPEKIQVSVENALMDNGISNAMSDANESKTDIPTLVANLSKIESEFGLSKWRTAEGKFNYARLASDATAGIVLGTTGALVTAHVVKKKQVEDGFESLECTVGGQHVGDWGDVFRIDGK